MIKFFEQNLTNKSKLALYFNSTASVRELVADLSRSVVSSMLPPESEPVLTKKQFLELYELIKSNFFDQAMLYVVLVEEILLIRYKALKSFKSYKQPIYIESLSDIKKNLDSLVFKGFITAVTVDRLADLVRYLKAITIRLEKLPADPQKDRELMLKLNKLELVYLAKTKNSYNDKADEIRWMFEECRVSLFAQKLKTKFPISIVRIEKALQKI